LKCVTRLADLATTQRSEWAQRLENRWCRYEAGDLLPVKSSRAVRAGDGQDGVTFEDMDEERWKTRPDNFREIGERLRPSLD